MRAATGLIRCVAIAVFAAMAWFAPWVVPATRAAPNPAPPADAALPATAARWLQQRPTIRVGIGPEWAPIDQFAHGGEYTGLSGTLLRAIAAQLNARIAVVRFKSFDLALAAAARGDIDLLPSMARTPARESTLTFSRAYVSLPTAFVGRYNVTDFSPVGNFGGRSIVVERGFVTQDYLRQRYPNARLLLRDSTREALEAVATGVADFYLGSLLPAHVIVEQALLPNLAVLGATPAHLNLGALHFAAPKHAQPLIAAINAAMDQLGPEYVAQLLRQLSPHYAQLRPLATSLSLSEREYRLVERLPELRVGFRSDHGPFSAHNAGGEPEGLAVAIFESLARQLGLRWRYYPMTDSAHAAQALTAGEVDIVIDLPRRPELVGSTAIVGPLYQTTTVLITRVDTRETDLSNLSGSTLAVPVGHEFAQTLARDWPEILLRQFDTLEHSLAAVRDRQVAATAVELDVAHPLLSLRYPGQLHVSSVVADSAHPYYLALPSTRADLALLLRRAFDAMPPTELAALRSRWLRTEVRAGVPWSRVIAIGGPILAALLVILAMILVINRRLRAEIARRQEAERGLAQARDLALADATAKSDFLASMAHELRTPMTGIEGLAALIGRDSGSALVQSRTEMLRRLVRSLNQLVTQVLDFSRMRAHAVTLSPQPVDLVQLVREAVAEYGAGAELKGLALKINIDTAPSNAVYADPLRLRQIVGNLLTNAIKFTQRGNIAIGLMTEALPDAHVRCRIAVSDTGGGIEPELLAALTGRFVQAPDAAHRFGGSGLGLSIVRELVEMMGGRLDIDSTPGAGSCFAVVLDFALVGSQESTGVLHAEALRPRVLLVEDDAISRLVIEQMLNAAAREVITATNPPDALEQLRVGRFDVLVTDLNLHDQSGIDLAASARAMDPHLWIVLCSASSRDELADLQAAGMVDAIVTKPVDLDVLIKAITRQYATIA